MGPRGRGRVGQGVWYGVRRFFDWLEGRAYRMHVRVLLSRYRAYDPCADCGGARLKDEALDWRVGSREGADAVLEPRMRFRHARVAMDQDAWETLPGLNIHDLMRLPIDRCREFFERWLRCAWTRPWSSSGRHPLPPALSGEVGLGYLTLDRQSRTLSGGEVQRINLTTALGTSLVNTLFVLDEPSIGLHPRDMDRVVARAPAAAGPGQHLLVVEHDPQVMLAADRILDIGPGPGEHGGRLVFQGTPGGADRGPGFPHRRLLAGRRCVGGEPEYRLPAPRTTRRSRSSAPTHTT